MGLQFFKKVGSLSEEIGLPGRMEETALEKGISFRFLPKKVEKMEDSGRYSKKYM